MQEKFASGSLSVGKLQGLITINTGDNKTHTSIQPNQGDRQSSLATCRIALYVNTKFGACKIWPYRTNSVTIFRKSIAGFPWWLPLIRWFQLLDGREEKKKRTCGTSAKQICKFRDTSWWICRSVDPSGGFHWLSIFIASESPCRILLYFSTRCTIRVWNVFPRSVCRNSLHRMDLWD